MTFNINREKKKLNPHLYYIPKEEYTCDFSFFPSFNESVPSFILTDGKHLCHFNSYQQAGWHSIVAAYLYLVL